MPVRDGRWVSWERVAEQEKAAKAAAPEPEPAPEPVAPKPKRSRRSKRAAQSAIEAATGLTVSLED